MYSSGTFTMEGGAVTDNSAAGSAGGVLVYGGGTFTMSGGAVTRNSPGGPGGGVLNIGTFALSGGSVIGNTGGMNVLDVMAYPTVFKLSGSPEATVTLLYSATNNAKITQADEFSGSVTVDFLNYTSSSSSGDWAGKTILLKDPGYTGGFGTFTLGNFIAVGDDSSSTVTPVSGYHIDYAAGTLEAD